MGAIRHPRGVVEVDEAAALAKGDFEGGDWDDRDGVAVLLALPCRRVGSAKPRGASDNERGVGEG